MFTGIIQGEGRIARLDAKGSEMRLLISPSFEIPSIVDGESIAVNGVCLSVETHSGSNFSLYASAETMRTPAAVSTSVAFFSSSTCITM